MDPVNSYYYYNLAKFIKHIDKTTVIVNSQTFTCKDLYIKCIELDPDFDNYYPFLELSDLLGDEENLIINNKTWNKELLIQHAIDLGYDDNGSVWTDDSSESDNEPRVLDDVFYYTNALYENQDLKYRIEYFINAIKLNPIKMKYYNELASILDETQVVTLANGIVYNKKTFYIRVLESCLLVGNGSNGSNEIDFAKLITNLAILVDVSEIIYTIDGQNFTRESLLKMAEKEKEKEKENKEEKKNNSLIFTGLTPFIESKLRDCCLSEKKECGVCFQEYTCKDDIVILSCGHDYCVGCLNQVSPAICGLCRKPFLKI